jgi:hypothetical protein
VCTGYDSATGQSMDFPSGQTIYIVFSTALTTATSVALVSMPRSGNLEDASLPVPSRSASATTAQPQRRSGLPGGLRSGGEGGTNDTRSRGLRI